MHTSTMRAAWNPTFWPVRLTSKTMSFSQIPTDRLANIEPMTEEAARALIRDARAGSYSDAGTNVQRIIVTLDAAIRTIDDLRASNSSLKRNLRDSTQPG